MGDFSWLAYGTSHGYTTASNCNDCPHYAVDIGTPFHTSITALFSGVVSSQATGIPWGTQLFIQPDDHTIPMYYYYHLDLLTTHVGEHVNAGDQVGLSGGQNSGGQNPTTPQYSSGPHTHIGFFIGYVATPNGSRPFGPDITPYVYALASGQSLPSGSEASGAPGMGSNSLAQLGEYLVESLGLSQSVVTAIAGVSQQPFAVIGGAALVVGAALLLATWALLNGGL